MEKILIIGGTNFIGRNLVEQLKNKDKYELTLLNRGITNANLFPGIKKIKGDRNTKEIAELVRGNWDYIIDLSCYFPKSLEHILGAISTKLKRFIFISTVSVYENGEQILKDESERTQAFTREIYDDDTSETYGKRKAACEEIIKSSGINYTILRPSLVYGKYDHTDRFYYWLYQVKKYEKVLLPNNGIQKTSLTYVQDLIKSIVLSINEGKDKNIYNIISHPETSIADIVNVASKLLKKSPETKNVSGKYLLDNNIYEWTKMPLWINSNYDTQDNKKILKSYNLEIVPLEESIKATIAYYQEMNWYEPKYGITRMKQLELMNNYEKELYSR
ncbi:hypothetical protein A9Q86_04845 [Flavobacteriales bacterium 33_180_T64]|nr:hypothetical protein A9Q86_04845 [Flavobacteriales bacterium 33_180_T64]